MKKLLILAAVIVAGIAANAASFKWSGANIYGSDGTTKFTGTADIYAYANTATIADAVIAQTVQINSGVLNVTANWTDATGGTTYNFYIVFDDNGKTFNSAISDPAVIKSGIAAATATTTIAFGNMTSATQSASNWSGAAVPEPTSGLLMLLGMAGLALRRRRA